MPRKLPPFSAVRAFESAARHLSFKNAADELCVTPSAISHQIKTLEDYLCTALFERDGNKIRLTKTGGAYAGRLTGLLDNLDQATKDVEDESRTGDIRVHCTPGFAARWLVPRLGGFDWASRIRLHVSHGAPCVDFATNDSDIVIQWGDFAAPGNVVIPLMESSRYPVASRELIEREDIRTPQDLYGATLIKSEVADGWDEWFLAAGLEPPEDVSGPFFSNCEYASTAAEQGLGVSLAYDAVVRDTIKEGRLVRLFDAVAAPFTIYSITFAESRRQDRTIQPFVDWLLREAAEEKIVPAFSHATCA